MDTIDQFREMEQLDFIRSQKTTGSMPKLVQTLCEIYDTLGSLIGSSHASPERVHGAIPFALDCRYELIMATMMAFRGHLSESHHFTRRAIELCAFAALISRHPHLTREWRQAWKDLSHYDKLREKFSTKKLFPHDQPELKQLQGAYDICSKFVHSSAFSMSGHIKVVSADTTQQYTFLYSELHEADLSEPVRTGIFILRAHALILRVFERILKTLTVEKTDRFSNQLAVFEADFLAFRQEWKETVLADDAGVPDQSSRE